MCTTRLRGGAQECAVRVLAVSRRFVTFPLRSLFIVSHFHSIAASYVHPCPISLHPCHFYSCASPFVVLLHCGQIREPPRTPKWSASCFCTADVVSGTAAAVAIHPSFHLTPFAPFLPSSAETSASHQRRTRSSAELHAFCLSRNVYAVSTRLKHVTKLSHPRAPPRLHTRLGAAARQWLGARLGQHLRFREVAIERSLSKRRMPVSV